MIPAVAESNGLTRLRHLREYLQRQDRLREARVILEQEIVHTPDGSEQEKACRSFLEVCSNQNNSEEPIWWIVGRSKLRLGQILMAGNQVQAGNNAFQGARRALEVARASDYENNTLLLVRLAELNSLSKFGNQDALQGYEEFVQISSVKKDNCIHSTALSRACRITLAQLESQHTLPNLRTFWQWNRKAEQISKDLGDIAYLMTLRLANGDIACALEGEYGAILKWHEAFEMKNPSFHLWRQRTNVRKTRLFIYNRLNDWDKVFRTVSEMRDVVADQDNFWRDDGFRKQASIKASSKNRKPDMPSAPAVYPDGDPEMDWLWEWSNELLVFMNAGWNAAAVQTGSDSIEAPSLLGIHLCLWIKEEFQAGILTNQDLTDILSSDSVNDADISQVSTSLDNHHIKHDEPIEHARDALESEASDIEKNSNSKPEDKVTSLTPETISRRLFGTHNAPTNESRWEKAYSLLSHWLLQKSSRSEARRHFLLFQIQSQRLSYVIDSAMSPELRALEAQRLIALFPKLNVKVQEHVSSNLAYWKSTIATAKYLMYIKSRGHVLRDMQCPELKEIMELYNQALADNRDKGGPLIREFYIYTDMAHVFFYAAAKMDPVAVDGFLDAAEQALETFERIRAGWRALTGWDRVEKLLLALKDVKILQFAPTAVTVFCQVPDNRREVRDKLVWNMIQFGKSIGISWLMDSNAADAGKGGKEHSKIHVEAVGLQGESEKASDPRENSGTQPDSSQNIGEDETTGKQQVHETSTGAKADDCIDDQTKVSLDVDQLQADLQNINRLGGDAVFVDWFNGACGLAESPRPIITTLSGTDEGPRCSLANIKWTQVDKLVNQFMRLGSQQLLDSDYTEFLYKLNPLVEPLAWTKPGQTLVFSPCGNLHRIPLHALKIDGEVLIKRNPVVYCSSLSALASTYRLRVQTELHSSSRSTADIPNSREPNPSPRADANSKVSLFGDPPKEIGRASLKATATRFQTEAHTGESFTASSFTSTLQDPRLRLLHYHGHADFNPDDHTDHCLKLSDRDLTLRDIFDLPSPLTHGGGFHVTLLGCGSGMSKTELTNDVVGLVPSFLYAGASSTVSTLWPFLDSDAAAYSEAFYQGFFQGGEKEGDKAAEEVSEDGGVVVDLAKANQRAVLGIMRDRPELYHWASFVLNGYWMMRSPVGK